MYVRPISTRLLSGMLIPAIRAKASYPCRCLCRGFWQITRTRPWRRMILHFSHIGLTDGRTFMIPFGVDPDGVALAAGTATATMPPESTSHTDVAASERDQAEYQTLSAAPGAWEGS